MVKDDSYGEPYTNIFILIGFLFRHVSDKIRSVVKGSISLWVLMATFPLRLVDDD